MPIGDIWGKAPEYTELHCLSTEKADPRWTRKDGMVLMGELVFSLFANAANQEDRFDGLLSLEVLRPIGLFPLGFHPSTSKGIR